MLVSHFLQWPLHPCSRARHKLGLWCPQGVASWHNHAPSVNVRLNDGSAETVLLVIGELAVVVVFP